MKEYSSRIALIENSRGIYGLDTSIGCYSGMTYTKNGCYGDCYAAKSAKIYGYDFSKTILRYFDNEYHRREIISQINNSKLDFIRIGCSGDPSENWKHCFSILKSISRCNKEIVIITKHWKNLTLPQLKYLNKINVCINTSVSALDDKKLLNNSLKQYHRIKPYCKSVLRIVSCDFNLENKTGKRLSIIQDELFKNDAIIDTIFRPSAKNYFVISGIVNIKKGVFNGHKAIISKYNKKTYSGKCAKCPEMCGLNLNDKNYPHKNKLPLTKQIKLFKNV